MFNAFFLLISSFAVDYFLLVPALIIFWNIDKRKGSTILCSYGCSIFIKALLKLTFCVYRPWIRDDRIKPVKAALDTATGYSFPSGHSTSASGFYGGLIVAFKKYWRTIVFGILMTLLTMFSRLYLGVHTPQDVLTGLVIGVIGVTITTLFLNLADKKKNADIIIYIICVLLVIGSLFYISFKKYPLDYDDLGNLIVDPIKMTMDGFRDCGIFLGIMTGWFIERRFVKFDVNGTKPQKVARAVIGALLYVIFELAFIVPIGKMIGNGIVFFFLKMSTPIIFMTIYPIIFKKIESKGFLASETKNEIN